MSSCTRFRFEQAVKCLTEQGHHDIHGWRKRTCFPHVEAKLSNSALILVEWHEGKVSGSTYGIKPNTCLKTNAGSPHCQLAIRSCSTCPTSA